jgi:FtsZ-binding cell division protein ZapB
MAENGEGRQRLEQAVASLESAVGGVATKLQEVDELKRRNTTLEQEVRTLKVAQDAVSARLDKAIEQLRTLLG